MADLALGGLEKILRTGLAIKKAVETADQNKKECRDIERSVARVSDILSWVNKNREALKHRVIRGPLEDLAESLDEALQLIKDCEGKHPMRRIFGAGAMARKLGRVHDDILRKLVLGNFATTCYISITITNTIPREVPPLHPDMQPQDAGEVVDLYRRQVTTGDARSGINSEITMVTTASQQVSYDPSSISTEFNSFGLEATMHHISEENTSRGGGHSVMKQKIVIKIGLASDESRRKALFLSAKMDGAISMAIRGDCKDMLEVIGEGMDAICLVSRLRRKVGLAQLLQVEQVKCEKPQRVEAPPAVSAYRPDVSSRNAGATHEELAPLLEPRRLRGHVRRPAASGGDRRAHRSPLPPRRQRK